MVPWSQIEVGDYVKDPNGIVWKIIGDDGITLRMVNRDGVDMVIPQPDPQGPWVEFVFRSTEALIEQVKRVQQQLGGKVIEHGERVEAFSDMTPASQARHLWVHHGNSSVGLSVATMVDLHDSVLHHQPLNERQHHHVNPGERIVIV